MKCKNCGSKVKDKHDYCPYCGEKITRSTEYTDISIILDKSGSMTERKPDTLKGLNGFLKEQATLEDRAVISLYQFNDSFSVTYENKDLSSKIMLEDNDYRTNGMTALNDSIGKVISTKEEHYKNNGKPDKILIVILTDGLENASKEYSTNSIRELIEAKKSEGWDFAFIGAGIDAFSKNSAGGMSIPRGSTISVAHSSKGIEDAFSYLTADTTRYRGATRGTTFSFTVDEKKKYKKDDKT